jgi:probable rRNA maturation factor
MIEVIIKDEGWREALPEAEALAERCQRAAAAFESALARETALLLCEDAAIRALNARFRQKDRATNVLSFPSGEAEGFLGDIALARETCVTEAAEKGVALRDHAAHLIIHAMLHLAGYDHQADEEAAAMEGRETEILASMGVSDPYGEIE